MDRRILRLRTADNLLNLLSQSKSGNWVIAQGKEANISQVEIISFDGTQKIVGVFDQEKSFRLEDGRLVVAFKDGYIQNCEEEFSSRNPVSYS